MTPTLVPGDRLRVDPDAYRDSPPRVGEVVVLIDPERPDRWLIKRVAGVGPGRFWRTPSGLAPILPGADARPPEDATQAITLASSTIYVMGDAPTARDSRRFGPVPLRAVIGRAYRIYAPARRRRDV